MLLLDATAPEDQRAKALADVERILSANGATVTSKHDWGQRRMSFEIRHRADAEYHLIQFQGPPSVPAELDRVLRIADGVLRFRTIKLDAGTPAPPDLREAATSAPAETSGEDVREHDHAPDAA